SILVPNIIIFWNGELGIKKNGDGEMGQAIKVKESNQKIAEHGVNQVIITEEQKREIEKLLPFAQSDNENTLLNM
ncbi:hypothetical protein COL84_30310, partial [Bacillus pseudomycoides]